MNPRVLVADPPWLFGDKLPGNKRGASRHYKCMTVADLCLFPTPAMHADSVLVLWRVAAMVPEAYLIAKAWGFTPKTELVWLKETVTGKRWFGMGRTLRASHEIAIVATRGKPKMKSLSTRTVFSAPVGRHSEKPDLFYDIIRDTFAGPYHEMFARKRRDGWAQEGDQL